MTRSDDSDQTPARGEVRRGRAAIKEIEMRAAEKKRAAKAKREDSPGVAVLRTELNTEKRRDPCNAMLAEKLGTLKRMKWTKEDAFIAICALRTEHQGGSPTDSTCPKNCLNSDERIAGMIETIYSSEVLPWNDDYERVEYLKRDDINADEAFLLLIMSQLTDSSGYNKAFYPQNKLVKITHMNKAEMAKVIYGMHNKGIITFKKGYPGKGSEYWLHAQPVKREPEDTIDINDAPSPKKKGPRKTRKTDPGK